VSNPTAEPNESLRLTLTATAERTGEYVYLPFEVPEGVRRVSVEVEVEGFARVGLGLFDERAGERGRGWVAYQSPGYRGVYGEERSECYVSAGSASPSFLPGVVRPGTWTVVVPVFIALARTMLVATVDLAFGPAEEPARPGPEQGVVLAQPGWYRGDLHCHTVESSDAAASGSALDPAGWADEARRIGLDFVALTDHNVVSQNLNLAHDAGEGVLLLGGEEMTNWPHGHAVAVGLSPGDWLDWRQRPAGIPLGPGEERIVRFIAEARALGAFISAAHPASGRLAWQFIVEGEADPQARPHGLEVWNGPWQFDDEIALALWDHLLRQGWRVSASGGSDTHGLQNTEGVRPGLPTTVVYAEELAKAAIVAALKAGRCFVAHSPRGPDLYLTAEGPNEQSEIVGGTVRGGADERVEFSARIKGAEGANLRWLRDGRVVKTVPLQSDDETHTYSQVLGEGGYVRAEVRGEQVEETGLAGGRWLKMLALTNPIYLEAT